MSVEGIKKKLGSEEEQSLAENIKKSKTKLTPDEIGAARKFVMQEREERNRQTAVAEELKGRIFGGHDGTAEENMSLRLICLSMPKVEKPFAQSLARSS